ncbi:hypothetical protein [Bosea sp. BK604]|uniref:hypothetical protein n=1 Tax=Bosea sp. BK604 TaxID=2512180 RepID=UPI00104A728E|nr:hypothetical protein [Bosea sp. BK604]TCR69691.1 hypothetical protein EV560_10188 [Bosea sp. BK604]
MNPEQPVPRREDLADGSVRVYFAAPIPHGVEPKGFVTFRPPTAGEVLMHDDPKAYVYNADGLGTPYTDRAALWGWGQRLIEGHDLDVIGRERDPALGMLIADVILDFFLNARKRLKPASAPSQTDSALATSKQ